MPPTPSWIEAAVIVVMVGVIVAPELLRGAARRAQAKKTARAAASGQQGEP